MTDEMRYRGNALLRDSIVGKVELLHVAAVTDAVEEKRQSLVANVVVIERQFADAHLLQQCGSHLDFLFSDATSHNSLQGILGIVQNKAIQMTRLQNSHQIAQCGSREIQSSTCHSKWKRKR